MLQEGEQKFREYIHNLKTNPLCQRPDLNSEPFSKGFSPVISIDETRQFNSKMELAEYLQDCFAGAGLKREDVVPLNGLWTWLAYIWFEQLTNQRRNILKREEHYICPTPSNFRRYYIHLVAPLYVIYSLHNLPFSRLFLYNPPWEINDFTERVATNQFLISHKNIVEAIYKLYFDPQRRQPKRGAQSRTKPGNIRRFVSVIQHFELTYDIYTMSADRILNLLPSEFDDWKK
jgi:hypothetical protein